MLNESKFLKLYHRQQESGLTVKDFCSNEGIPESTFYYWRKKLQKNNTAQDFIPLVVKSSSQSLSTQSLAKSHPSVQGSGEIPASQAGGDNYFLLELVYPNGTKLRVKNDINLTHLRALIHLYD
jgi:hypothetical protein